MHNATPSTGHEGRIHRVLVVGGLARLERRYRCCGPAGVTVEVANINSAKLAASVTHSDSIVVVVTNVSHAAAENVKKFAQRRGVPVSHAVGSSARHISERILELTKGVPNAARQ